MPDSRLTFRIEIPTDAGFVGRECPGDECGRYFRIHADSLRDRSYCPYCGLLADKSDFTTNDQLDHVRRAGIEQAKEYMYGEIDKMFADTARKFRGNRHVTFTHHPIRYRAKATPPTYQEREVDSEITCPDCQSGFQVYGIFGYCPGCGQENVLVYDANIAILRQEIARAADRSRALRHAYGDLVSAFEAFCKKANQRIHGPPCNFQELFQARRHFKKHADCDILSALKDDELLLLRRVFQKRHAYEHGGGTVTDRYVKKVPEDAALLGQKAPVSLDEFNQAASLLHRVLDRLTRATGGG